MVDDILTFLLILLLHIIGPGRSRGSTPPDARMMDPDIDDEEDDEFNDQINPPDKAVSN